MTSRRAPRTLLRALALLAVLAATAAGQVRFKQGTLTLAQLHRQVTLVVEVADTPAAREQGLMHRRALPERAGMLFIFETTGRWGFWMKNTLIPLSIAFIGEDWRIVDIQDMQVAPDPARGPFTIYEPSAPARYALEVNQGFFARAGITVGARVTYVPRP